MHGGPRPGDAAPDFSAPDAHGRTLRLRDFRGRPVVLYFYPRDFTAVCTREACEFRDQHSALEALGAKVIGVSPDPPERHGEFARRHRLPFALVSDVDGHVRRLYGVRPFLGLVPGRVTFVIDADGVVRRRFASQYRGARHAEEALEGLRGLTASTRS